MAVADVRHLEVGHVSRRPLLLRVLTQVARDRYGRGPIVTGRSQAMAGPFERREVTCIVEGCAERGSRLGRCDLHYRQHRSTSDGVRPGGRKRKLTDEQVSAIRKRSAAFATTQEIAAEFGVTTNVVRDVLKRRGAYEENPAPQAVPYRRNP